MFKYLPLLFLAFLMACSAATTPAPADTPASADVAMPATDIAVAETPSFAGRSITVLTHTGPQIYEPIQRRAAEYQALTGAEIEVQTVPFSELYETILSDFEQQTGQYDVVVFSSQWMVDYAEQGYLVDLTDLVQADPAIRWDDIAPFFRDFSAVYDEQIYTIPLDGDFQMVYYRSDLLEAAGFAPPKTWEDYLVIAEHFHGQDLNGDSRSDFGSCIAKKSSDQAYHMVWSVASAYIQSQGTSQGAFFDAETMEPLVQNEAFAATLDIFARSTAFGPPDELELGLPAMRNMFIEGRCALTLDWGDIGTLAIDPAQSQVVDKVGAVILPGSERVLDRASGKLVDCDKARCPYAIDGVNHAPYAAFGGWSGAINSSIDAARQELAYAFLSYVSQPARSNIDVTIGSTGFNPYRISQFTNREAWLAAGMSETAARKYLGAIGVSLNSPNVVLDLRVPQNQRYQEVVLDAVLAEFLAGSLSREQAMQQIYTDWEQITDEVGRASQNRAYQSSLGFTSP